SLITGLSGTADGKRLAFHKLVTQSDVYVAELEAHGTRLRTPRRLTLDDRNDYPSAWTPDSRAVLFESDRNGAWTIYRQAIDQESAAPIVAGDQPRLSPDGAWILYLDRNPDEPWPSAPVSLMRVPTSGGASQLVLTTRGEQECARLPSTL